jgi:anti-sigma28 factor (negative regulator of flagellin synthesis)
MDVVDNEPSPTSNPPHRNEAVPTHAQGEEHSCEYSEAPDLLDLWLSAGRELARRPAPAVGDREAKIRALRHAIKSGTYQVAPEQIADKMLRDTLRDQLP